MFKQSRKEAITTGDLFYFTGNPCVNGHLSKRYSRGGMYRRAAKLNATPSWLTNEQLRQIDLLYAEAVRLSNETDIKYHVDHIIPLQGETVSGLHVPSNLRVIPAFDNLSKHNRLIEAVA